MSITRKLMILSLIVIAIGLLYPGVTQPVLTLSGTVEKSKIAELGIDLVTEQGAASQTGQMFIPAHAPFGGRQSPSPEMVIWALRFLLYFLVW